MISTNTEDMHALLSFAMLDRKPNPSPPYFPRLNHLPRRRVVTSAERHRLEGALMSGCLTLYVQ